MSDHHFYFPGPTQAGIALGSNLGDSNLIFSKAITRLQEIHLGPPSTFLVSSLYKTAPLNCPPNSPDFLNAVIQLETSLSSYDLIGFLQKIEAEAGRTLPRIQNTPRTLDLDLLYHGTNILTTDLLTLPHPRVLEREFVLGPLSEMVPHFILPGWKKTAQEYLLDLKKNHIN
ncbi:MAG: 2-amino-4-hydroxy-6-hydroxymethyldihydropteridine diphosphokinase [Alphaproteobacteria bacterium]|nr:2-amino-4-hydroxy-6-hydroxymethyldihydropteridine diphosphokinase [Chthoniobacterales bacterium]MBY0463127.1 2-amino-4-hydroxy-6-hydroxymethyldihydropteridine diphosphokinase [Alphaproteobacteria bacterium]